MDLVKAVKNKLFMKRILLIALLCTSIGSITASAQSATYKASSPVVSVAGHYNSSGIGLGGNYSATVIPYAISAFPLYTHTSTVTNTGVDTVKAKILGFQNSVYTWCHVTGVTGTNTSCTIKLWASADSGKGADFIPIQTFTVSATNPVAYYLINSGNGWPYTNFWWTFQGVGTQVSTWYSGLFVR